MQIADQYHAVTIYPLATKRRELVSLQRIPKPNQPAKKNWNRSNAPSADHPRPLPPSLEPLAHAWDPALRAFAERRIDETKSAGAVMPAPPPQQLLLLLQTRSRSPAVIADQRQPAVARAISPFAAWRALINKPERAKAAPANQRKWGSDPGLSGRS